MNEDEGRVTITRRFEFDAAHRLPSHRGRCRRIHGHRWVVEATLHGAQGRAGMLLDFGTVKATLGEWIDRNLDHKFIASRGDSEEVLQAIRALSCDQQSVVVCPLGEPTSENLVRWIAAELQAALEGWLEACQRASEGLGPQAAPERLGLALVALRLYETPNCWADWRAE